MPGRRHRLTFLRRALRADALRLVLIVLICPMLVLGAFGGTTILAHRHHGHAIHWHAGATREAAINLASAHIARHKSTTGVVTTHSDCGGVNDLLATKAESSRQRDESLQSTLPADPHEDSGLIITIPDHDQLTRRASMLVQPDTTLVPLHAVALVLIVSNTPTASGTQHCHGCGPPRQ